MNYSICSLRDNIGAGIGSYFNPAIKNPISAPYNEELSGFEVIGHVPVEHPTNL
jgi:hypothetical protein